MENQIDIYAGFGSRQKARLIKNAVHATILLLNSWCDGRFKSLPSIFSKQMDTYWTPEVQKLRYHALAINRECIKKVACLDQTPSHVSHSYIFLFCRYDCSLSAKYYAATIILRNDGLIMAFYI